jgi:hypothetical protein
LQSHQEAAIGRLQLVTRSDTSWEFGTIVATFSSVTMAVARAAA